MELPVKRKALAYITNGNRLLVFRQPNYPDAGIQVPGGTIRDDETPVDAVIREAREETGLNGLVHVSFLGDVLHDRTPFGEHTIHHRRYFHLRIDGPVQETSQHIETDPSEGEDETVLFEFFWVDLPDGIPELIRSRDEMIPALLASLRRS